MQRGLQAKVFSIGVVIPCYKVSSQILDVIHSIGIEVDKIIIVDDCCPELTGNLVAEKSNDPRIEVLYHTVNQGVGASVVTGYRRALELGLDIIVKVDGDGQMDTTKINNLIKPLIESKADYTKGNRFFDLKTISQMPLHRLIGNAGLSFFSKISTGYWSLFDPNNGFTAIKSDVLRMIPLEKLEKRYFFESDMLFRLNLSRVVVFDVPIPAIYGEEKSNLSPLKSVYEFSFKHTRNLAKRIFYNYFLRDFSIASLNLFFGVLLLLFGVISGWINWLNSVSSGIPTRESALILVTISIVVGLQLFLNALSYDIQQEPKNPLT